MINSQAKQGYKHTPLGWIPEEWKLSKLEALVEIKSGESPTVFNLKREGKYPYIKVEDLNNCEKYQSKSRQYSDDNKGLVPPESIIFPKRGAAILNNKVRINSVSVQMDSNLMSIQPNTLLVEPEFLYYKILHTELFRIADTSTIPQINNKHILPYIISLPPLPEQKAIAKVLSTWDEAISKTQELITQKELRKKWLMQQLLTGKKRLKGFKGEWKEMHLGELFSERNETNFNDLPLLSIGQGGVYPQDESIKKDTSNEDKSKYRRICHGDIGYNTMRMWQGRSALSKIEGIVSPAYTIVTPRKNADSLFFSYLFKTPKLIYQFWRNSQGLVDDTLNCKFKDFKIVKTEAPPIKEEQTAIANILFTADQEIEMLESKLETVKEQKKGLMQVLLSGKKRIKNI